MLAGLGNRAQRTATGSGKDMVVTPALTGSELQETGCRTDRKILGVSPMAIFTGLVRFPQLRTQQSRGDSGRPTEALSDSLTSPETHPGMNPPGWKQEIKGEMVL